MITNVKIRRKLPAIILITPDDFSLNYYYQGKELTINSSAFETKFNDDLESKLSAVLKQIKHRPCRLIIVLSAQLTLLSEQEFPAKLSAAQIDELFRLQLSKRTPCAEINTFYDYFLLKETVHSSTYGLIEARKDVLSAWITIFERYDFKPVSIVSQAIVLINHVIRNSEISSDWMQIVCLLPARIMIAHVISGQVEKVTEHVTSATVHKLDSMVNIIKTLLLQELAEVNHPTIILDAVNCGITDQVIGHVIDNYMVFPGFPMEKINGENTFKCLRTENDMYQSVALA